MKHLGVLQTLQTPRTYLFSPSLSVERADKTQAGTEEPSEQKLQFPGACAGLKRETEKGDQGRQLPGQAGVHGARSC